MTITLTSEQSAALSAITSFLRDDKQDTFILRGSAGTGKTTLIAKLVGALEDLNLSCALLAPTGRAARILGNKIKQITQKDEYIGSMRIPPKLDTCSAANWTVVPSQTGHLFQAKLDTLDATARG